MLGGFITIILLGIIYMLIGICVEYAFHKVNNSEEDFYFDWTVIALWIKRLI